MPNGSRRKVFLHLNAEMLDAQARRYGGRPHQFLSFRRARPEDLNTFDFAVRLWAQAEEAMDQWHATQQQG